MWRIAIGIFAAIGFAVVLLLVGAGIAFTLLRPAEKPLSQRIVLTADLTQGLAEGRGESPLQRAVFGATPNLRDFLDGLEAAGRDPRVRGIVARVGGDALGLARIQQVRDAIARFRARGKFAIAYADSFGELGPGTRPYYLATAFNAIWLQPMGMVGLVGLESEVMFFKGTLALLGVAPDFSKREQFKTAINSLTESQMTPPHREEVESLVNALGGQIVAGIAAGRHLPAAEVRQDIDKAPFFATEALQAKLVDRLGYRDEALAEGLKRAGPGAERLSLASYLDRVGRPHQRGPTIALIYGTGLVQEEGSRGLSLFGENVLSARALGRAFRAAVRDPKVRAILFRIDSPGGSVVASEAIWRDVVFARRHGKPVVVSMGDLAGSGGYYIAAPADKIVAEPATLTASIGVFAGKLVLSGLYKKLGVTTDSVSLGSNAGMFSATAAFSGAGKSRLETMLDLIYRGFKERVASGRHMPPDQVEAVAKGRVWTGEEAKARGLVDALGGYEVALRLAKKAAGLAPSTPVRLAVYPPRKGVFETLYARLHGENAGNGAAAEADAAAVLARALPALPPLLRRLANPGVLTMPPLGAPR